MDGGRYLKLDDFKDQDDDFLSPKKTLRDFEGGVGTTYVCRHNDAELADYSTSCHHFLSSLPVQQAIFSRDSQNSLCVSGDCHVGPGGLTFQI